MRLFVGCELPEAVADALAAWTRAIAGPGVRPLPASSLHVTLFFLGERAEDELPDLRAAMRDLPAGPVPLATAAPGQLGRVVAIDLEDPRGALAAVHACGFPGWMPERRRFRPHVTVARLRGAAGRLSGLPAPPALAFDAPALALFRSWPGSRYEALERVTLPRT